MSGKRQPHVPAATALGEHPAGANTSSAQSAIQTGNECSRDTVHSDELPTAGSSQAHVHEQIANDEDDSCKSIQHHFKKAKRVREVKQCNPSALFRLSSFADPVRTALDLHLRRHAKQPWMRAQKLSVPKAALAAAHEAMDTIHENVYDCGRIEYMRNVETDFDALGFLNCGIPVKPRKGYPSHWTCRQVEYCPRCNLILRVKPAKYEFLPAFERGKTWWSITVMGRSNPRNCGVKIEIGRNSKNKPIYRYLFRPSDHIQFPKLSKFGVEDIYCRPQIVGEALYAFMNWLTDGKYFDGLHVFRDISLSFFPNRASCTGVGHTVNCHSHGYGNSSRQFTGKEAARMWMACAKLLRKHDGKNLPAYPDIVFRPLPTPAALKSAINYVIKPFKFANWYLNGLKHGCPLEGLNLEFNEIAFDTEEMLCATKAGSVFGNMSQKSRRYYIGKPPPVILKQHQVERFLELQAKDEAYGWEFERYQNHLKLVAKKEKRQRQRLK